MNRIVNFLLCFIHSKIVNMKRNKTRVVLDVFLNFLLVIALRPLLTIPATIDPSFVGLVYLNSSKETISTLEDISVTFTLTPLVDKDILTKTTVHVELIPECTKWRDRSLPWPNDRRPSVVSW